MNHRARKRFGQNFLQSQPVIETILAALNLQHDDKVVEIGPGLGALTKPLLRRLDKLSAIEIDKDLQAYWQSLPEAQEKLDLIGADALAINYSQWGNDLRIVGNLPYNISTPLLLHLLSYTHIIRDMHFMLQKEVVERLAGQPGTRDYGRLSVMVQYHCEVEYLFDVPPEAFEPMPKVDSAIVRLTPYSTPPFKRVAVDVLEKLVATAFGMRRKTLANNLKPLISADKLEALGIDPGLRPEQITVAQYVDLANHQTNQ
ncbi:16S rRNA (adenine(1518)-N(6)/adenine(1519)-N(6))-dimethyltransferase RsmA [Legionella dresdenensis]|uniref:Ribosomal RNA small subunit methyltransferase A n=1 Tax=Legionella dresdenensis TaxID=450200 RepID=A0ABV8CDR3_9GAMM